MPERKPIEHIGRFDKPTLLAAIQEELTRLCGDSDQDKSERCRHTWGSAVAKWAIVEQLPPASLRTGLKKLYDTPTPEQPPITITSQTDVTTEESTFFPPSDGWHAFQVEEGPSQPPGDTIAAGSSPGQGVAPNGEPWDQCPAFSGDIRCCLDALHLQHNTSHDFSAPRNPFDTDAKVAPLMTPNGAKVDEPPAEPRMAPGGLVVDPGDTRTLLVWAYMNGQQSTFDTMTEGKPQAHDTPILSKASYQGILKMCRQGMGVGA
jgi:hypothetical protein